MVVWLNYCTELECILCVFECVFISETSSNRSTSRLKEWSWWRSPRCKKTISLLLKNENRKKIAKQKSLTGYCDTNVCTRQDQLILKKTKRNATHHRPRKVSIHFQLVNLLLYLSYVNHKNDYLTFGMFVNEMSQQKLLFLCFSKGLHRAEFKGFKTTTTLYWCRKILIKYNLQ
jgi:hypothetical protein